MKAHTETPDDTVQSHSTSPLSTHNDSLSPPGGPPGAQEVPVADTPQLARQPCVRANSLVVQWRPKRPCRASLKGHQAGSQ